MATVKKVIGRGTAAAILLCSLRKFSTLSLYPFKVVYIDIIIITDLLYFYSTLHEIRSCARAHRGRINTLLSHDEMLLSGSDDSGIAIWNYKVISLLNKSPQKRYGCCTPIKWEVVGALQV